MSRDEYVEAIERALEPVAMKHNMEISIYAGFVTVRMTVDRAKFARTSELISGAVTQSTIDDLVSRITAWAEANKAGTGQ